MFSPSLYFTLQTLNYLFLVMSHCSIFRCLIVDSLNEFATQNGSSASACVFNFISYLEVSQWYPFCSLVSVAFPWYKSNCVCLGRLCQRLTRACCQMCVGWVFGLGDKKVPLMFVKCVWYYFPGKNVIFPLTEFITENFSS